MISQHNKNVKKKIDKRLFPMWKLNQEKYYVLDNAIFGGKSFTNTIEI